MNIFNNILDNKNGKSSKRINIINLNERNKIYLNTSINSIHYNKNDKNNNTFLTKCNFDNFDSLIKIIIKKIKNINYIYSNDFLAFMKAIIYKIILIVIRVQD